jgi:hypothetical protein
MTWNVDVAGRTNIIGPHRVIKLFAINTTSWRRAAGYRGAQGWITTSSQEAWVQR